MIFRYRTFLFFLFLLFFYSCAKEPRKTDPSTLDTTHKTKEKVYLQHPNSVSVRYPKTESSKIQDNYFGTIISDPYRWLEDQNAPLTQAWLNSQNNLSSNYLNALSQKKLIHERLKELWNYERYSPPFKEGNYYYYYYNSGLLDQSILYQTTDLEKLEAARIILDPNILFKKERIKVTDFQFSKSGKYIAFATMNSDSDWQRIKIIDSKNGAFLTDQIDCLKDSKIAWYQDGFFYTRLADPFDTKKQPLNNNEFHQVWYHKLGTLQQDDRLVFADPSHPNNSYKPFVTEDEQILVISVAASKTGNAILFKRLTQKNSYLEPLVSDFMNSYDFLGNRKNKLLFRTNYQAPNYQIIEIDIYNPQSKNWNILVPQMPDLLEMAKIVGNRLLLQFIKDVRHVLKVYEIDGHFVGNLALPNAIGEGTPITIRTLSGQRNASIGSFSISSFSLPDSPCLFNIQTLKSEVWKQPNVKFSPQDYVTEQVFYNQGSLNGDTVKIPMFITHKKGLDKKGLNPTILSGFGAFNKSNMPRFAIDLLPFLEKGGIYAVANIRGGGEYGKKWQQQAILFNKQNTFNDFIGAAEYLIAKGYTNANKLAIEGYSNGGLLIGTCITQRPDLFRVAIPIAGIFDMLRYHKLGLGESWQSEYGTSETEVSFKNLLSYSPLHNIIEEKYPATMIMTTEWGTSLIPAHSYKFAATLQKKQQSERPIILRVNKNIVQTTADQIEEIADKLAFILFNLQG